MIPLSDTIRSRTVPVVNIGIIITCVLVFLLQMFDASLVERLAFRPSYLLSQDFFKVGPIWVILSMLFSIFLHGGLLHIGSNMLFLWVFGDNVEERMGHVRYLVFYLICGIAATIAHSISALVGISMGSAALNIPVIGASGAIAGVLGAYLVLFPHSTIRSLVILIFFITLVNIPAPLFIIFWFILQIFSGVGSLGGLGGGVAYWAHIGGFVVGYLWAGRMFTWRRRRRPPEPRIIDINMRDL